MFRKISLFVCLSFVGLTPGLNAMTAEQKAKIHGHFEAIGMECIKEYPITEDDIKTLRAQKVPTGENAPCFLACVMKSIGVMDDKGKLQKESALEMAKKVFDDEEEIKSIENYLHSCSHVNDESVSDEDKGCQRAIMAHKCMVDNAAQFGFDV